MKDPGRPCGDVLKGQEQQGLFQFPPLEGQSQQQEAPLSPGTVKPCPNPEPEYTLACACRPPTAVPEVDYAGRSKKMGPESNRRIVDTGSPPLDEMQG